MRSIVCRDWDFFVSRVGRGDGVGEDRGLGSAAWASTFFLGFWGLREGSRTLTAPMLSRAIFLAMKRRASDFVLVRPPASFSLMPLSIFLTTSLGFRPSLSDPDDCRLRLRDSDGDLTNVVAGCARVRSSAGEGLLVTRAVLETLELSEIPSPFTRRGGGGGGLFGGGPGLGMSMAALETG